MQPNLFDLLGEDNLFKEQKANDYYWTLKDLANVSKNNKKVFSCFACGGGEFDGLQISRV